MYLLRLYINEDCYRFGNYFVEYEYQERIWAINMGKQFVESGIYYCYEIVEK